MQEEFNNKGADQVEVIDRVAENAEEGSQVIGAVERTEIIDWCNNVLSDWFTGDVLIYVRTGLLLLVAVGLSALLWWLTRKILIEIIHGLAYKSKTKWDDYLVKNRFFAALAL